MTVPIEFQAVILCGHGHRLYPLTEQDHLPKALLPIAGRPLISYPLGWLEKEGIYGSVACCSMTHRMLYYYDKPFLDVIVVAHKYIGPKLLHYFNKVHVGSVKIDLVLQEDEEGGSLDALLLIKDRIKRDVVVLSCDLVIDFPFYSIVEKYRLEKPTLFSVLVKSIVEPTEAKSKSADSSHWSEIIALDSKEEQLLMLAAKSDVEEEVQIPFQLLQKYPHIKLHTDLCETHFYIMNETILKILAKLRERQSAYLGSRRRADDIYTSFREECIPWLLSLQYKDSSILRQVHEELDNVENLDEEDPLFIKSSTAFSCKAFIVTPNPQHQVLARAYSLQAYAELNRHMAKIWTGPRVPPSSEVSPKTQIGNDALIGENTKIGERCSVKKSIIGSFCHLGSNIKLNNCVILDHVTIEDGVKLDNVIVCQKALIREKSSLKDCEVGVGYTVERECKFIYLVAKGETLVGERGMRDQDDPDMEHPMDLHIGH